MIQVQFERRVYTEINYLIFTFFILKAQIFTPANKITFV